MIHQLPPAVNRSGAPNHPLRGFAQPEPIDDEHGKRDQQDIEYDHLAPFFPEEGWKKRSRLALVTTVNEESDIAAPATTGFNNIPVKG